MTRTSRRLAAAIGLAFFAATPAVAATKIKLMYTAVSPYMASFVAKDQGFFEKRGLDVELILAPNGSVIVASVVADAVQVGTPTPTVFLQAVDAGLDQVALAATNVIPDTSKSGVIARTESNIKLPQDLVGKKVGVPGINGLLDVIFRKWLADQGIDTKRLTYVELAFPVMSEALKTGNVDAVVAVDPFYTRILDQKTGYLLDDYTKTLPAGTIASVYSATAKWANANPDAVRALQEGLVEAIAYAKSNETSARESLARYTRLPPPVVANLPIPNLVARIAPKDLDFWIGVMKQREMLTGTPDPAKVVWPWKGSN